MPGSADGILTKPNQPQSVHFAAKKGHPLVVEVLARRAGSPVLELGCGVCQDFTHLMLATMRQLGIPVRYTSGYLNQHINQKPRQVQVMGDGFMYQDQMLTETPWRGTGASHAWVEAYFGPEHGWRGFDAANNLLIDQNFIRIGAGRDFRDITPVKGVHKGPAEEDLKVTVDVTRIA